MDGYPNSVEEFEGGVEILVGLRICCTFDSL